MRARIQGKPEPLKGILDRALAPGDRRAADRRDTTEAIDEAWRKFRRAKAQALGWPVPDENKTGK